MRKHSIGGKLVNKAGVGKQKAEDVKPPFFAEVYIAYALYPSCILFHHTAVHRGKTNIKTAFVYASHKFEHLFLGAAYVEAAYSDKHSCFQAFQLILDKITKNKVKA
jgi:hypothetical protein